MATVRYIVNDVDESVKFYTQQLGFALKQQFGPNMAILAKDDLTLWLAGPGGRQILCEDPSGNVIELFQASA